MLKRFIAAAASVFALWVGIDFLIRVLVLAFVQEDTVVLWKPMGRLMMGNMWTGTLITAACFVMIYALLVRKKSFVTGAVYGLIFGACTGFSIGVALTTVRAVPLTITAVWFLGFTCQSLLAGIITALIIKKEDRDDNQRIVEHV